MQFGDVGRVAEHQPPDGIRSSLFECHGNGGDDALRSSQSTDGTSNSVGDSGKYNLFGHPQ
jgi:hypothetical protein